LAVETLAFAVLVGVAGSAGWRMIRVVAVLTIGAFAVWLERSHQGGPRGRRQRLAVLVPGLATVIVGLAGTVTGVGIGVMHLVKADLGLTAAAGLAALAAGLTLLAVGAARLWRATRGWWRLLALPVAFVVFQFVLVPFSAAIYATNLPTTELGLATPADRGLAYQDVTLTTTDEVRLSAWYLPSTNGAAVVLLHGAGSTRTAVLDQAVVLARRGYGVLMPDARGHGRSGGVGMDFGWWGDHDVDASVTWLAGRADVTGGRIAAVGLSMGGEEAIGAAAADPRIRAVVAEGALWRGSMDTGWLPRDPEGLIERGMLRVQTVVTRLLTSAPQPISLHHAISEIAPRPVLLIAGGPELRGDRYLRSAAPRSVDLWELPDTPHVGGLARHPTEWQGRVVGFLDRALPAATSS
jgi:pimeloyl-ACP methyl ester carboxylesterase